MCIRDRNGDGTKEWMIVDTTWDSNLKINDASGTVTGETTPKQIYFDPTMEDFSKAHRTDGNGNDKGIIGGTLEVAVTAGDSDTKANVTITPSDFRGWDTYGVTVSDGENETTYYWLASTTKPVTKSIDVTQGKTYTVSVIGYNTYQAIIEDGRAYGIEAAPIQYTAETGDVPDDKTYTITYELNGGENNNENPLTYKASTKKITLKNPTKFHFTFLGWYDSPDFNNRITEIVAGSTGNITLYAKWKVGTYKISFYGGKVTSGGMSVMSGLEYGKTYTLHKNQYIKNGYTFKGWNTKVDGSGTPYQDGQEIKDLGNISLYAQWTKNTRWIGSMSRVRHSRNSRP